MRLGRHRMPHAARDGTRWNRRPEAVRRLVLGMDAQWPSPSEGLRAGMKLRLAAITLSWCAIAIVAQAQDLTGQLEAHEALHARAFSSATAPSDPSPVPHELFETTHGGPRLEVV